MEVSKEIILTMLKKMLKKNKQFTPKCYKFIMKVDIKRSTCNNLLQVFEFMKTLV